MGGRGSKLIERHIKGNDNRDIDVKTLNDPETEYHNDMFKKLKEFDISTRKSTDDIDDMVLKRQQEQMLNIAIKYKKILQNTKQVHEMQLGAEVMKDDKVIAYCGSYCDDGQIMQRIALNKEYYTDYDKITETVKSGIRKGWFVPINIQFKSRDYIITHENGHAIENGIMMTLLKKDKLSMKEFNYYKKHYQAKIKKEILEILKQENPKDFERQKIYLSKYSKATDGEWFAETFTNFELADEPAPIAKALGEYIRRYNK